MRSATRERILLWCSVPALAAVLVVLAVLQYRWSGQVSAATRAQMESNLRVALMGFRQDLARELGGVCLEVRTAARESGKINPAQVSEQFQHWQQTAAHPSLVSYIYLTEPAPGDQRLLRIDPVRNQAASVEWPSSFEALRQHLNQMPVIVNRAESMQPRRHEHHDHHDRALNPGRGPGLAGGRRRDIFMPWMADQSIPALIFPLRSRNTGRGPSPVALRWIVIELNAQVLEKEIFPELAQRYFGGSTGLDYKVAVLQNGAGYHHVLYSSAAGFGEDQGLDADASLNLFGPPIGRTGPGPAAAEFFAPAPAPNDQADPRRTAVLERMMRIEPFRYSAEDGVWQLVVKHQHGSVEAVVARLRERNLAVSFGVLLLLAVTMAMILITSQRARKLARLQMDFVAGVSHELRTPLAVISSAAENIAHGVVEDRQQVVRYGSSILKHSRQLAHLVEQVLFFAAARKAPSSYNVLPVSISEVVDNVLDATAGIIKEAGFTVEQRIPPDLPPVSADFTALVQCLQNLVTNAVKYGGERRWLCIRAAVTQGHGAGKEVELAVEDRGIGISPKEMKHIFEPFYRSPAIAGSRIHGTGLGLPLARTIVEAIGGRLTAQSEPGQGSTFTIHLPVAEAPHLADVQSPVSDPTRAATGYSS